MTLFYIVNFNLTPPPLIFTEMYEFQCETICAFASFRRLEVPSLGVETIYYIPQNGILKRFGIKLGWHP